MSCFWDGLLRRLDGNDLEILKLDKKPSAQQFAIHLKKLNKLCNNVVWNEQKLSTQFLYECRNAINEYDPNTVNKGYFCSTCDPFLILLCDLLNISLVHNYNGNIVKYDVKSPRKTFNCSSNTRHFN